MNKKLHGKVEKSLRLIENIELKDLESFITQTINIIEELRTVVNTGSSQDQKEAIHLLNQMQRKFQDILDTNYGKFGFTPQKLEAILDPSNFTKEQWAIYEKTQKELERYKQKLSQYN